MLVGSGAVILKKHTEYAVGGLLGVVIIQGFGYGLIFDLNFFLRNLSVIGGLFMVFSDSMVSRKALFAGLPSISETDRKKFFEDRKLNKVERANNAVPHLANRFVIVNEMLANKETLIAEALSFPKGRHDDFVDTLVDAIKYTYGRSYSTFDVI